MKNWKNLLRKLRKGSLKREPVFYILLFVFVLLVLVLFITGLLDLLKDLLGFEIDPVSLGSAMALACGINSLAVGDINDYTCMNDDLLSVGSVEVYPLYKFDDVISFLQASSSPTANIIYDFKRLRRKIENKISGLFGIELAYAEENDPVAYVFGESVVVCANKSILHNKKYWRLGLDSNKMNEMIRNNFQELDDPNFKCKIFKFELKQKTPYDLISESGVKYGIPRLGDPDILVYYGIFPQGESQAWMDTTESWGVLGIVLGGAINAIPVAGHLLKGARAGFKEGLKKTMEFAKPIISSSAKALSKEMSERAFQKALSEGLEKSIATYLRKEGIDQALSKSIAKEIMKADTREKAIINVRKILEEKGVPNPQKKARKLVKEYSVFVGAKNRNKEIIKAIISEDMAVRSLLTSKNGYLFGIENQKFNKFIEALDESGLSYAEKVDALSHFLRGEKVTLEGQTFQLDEYGRKAVREQIGKYISEEFLDEAKRAARWYDRAPEPFKTIIVKLIIPTIEAMASRIEAMGGPSGAAKTWIRQSAAVHYVMIDALATYGLLDGMDITNIDIDGDGKSDPVLLEPVSKCIAVLGYKSKWNRRATALCSVLVLAGLEDVFIKSKLQYYVPAGVNAIGVYHPTMYFSNQKPISIPLVKEALPYFISLDRSDGIRMYFASPCLANLTLEKSEKECAILPCKRYEEIYQDYIMFDEYLWGCVDESGNCVINSIPLEDVGDKGICWCEGYVCKNNVKCEKWVGKVLGCGKINGKTAAYPVYNFGTTKFMVASIDTIQYQPGSDITENIPGYKVCKTREWYESNPVISYIIGTHLDSYMVPSIKIHVTKSDKKPNFCYYDGDAAFLEVVGYQLAIMAIDLFLTVITSGAYLTVASFATGAASAWVDEYVNKKYRWPGLN